jgi:hypothetical protein
MTEPDYVQIFSIDKSQKAPRMPSATRETVDSQKETLHEKANSAIPNISLSGFYSASIVAKIWEVARRALDKVRILRQCITSADNSDIELEHTTNILSRIRRTRWLRICLP